MSDETAKAAADASLPELRGIEAFETHLRYEARLPIEWAVMTADENPISNDLRLKRALGVLAAQTAFDDRRSESSDENAPLAPELQRLDAKLSHLIDLVGALLSRSGNVPETALVCMNAWGVGWQSQRAVPAMGCAVLVRVHLESAAAFPLELPARMCESIRRVDGSTWQRAVFVDIGDAVADAIERLVFRMHRRHVADARSLVR